MQQNKLTNEQVFKLYSTLKEAPLKVGDTYGGLAAEYQRLLGFPINGNNIRSALRTLERKIPQAEQASLLPSQELQIIAQWLVAYEDWMKDDSEVVERPTFPESIRRIANP